MLEIHLFDLVLIVFCSVISGGITNEIVRNKLDKIKEDTNHPFKWKCQQKGCMFEIASNHMLTADALIKSHQARTGHTNF